MSEPFTPTSLFCAEKLPTTHQNSTGDRKIISIEGNIGSGKSTLVEELRKKFGNNEKVCFLQEPVDIWNTIKLITI